MPEMYVKGVTLVPGGILCAKHRRQEGKMSPSVLGVFIYYLSYHWGQLV